MTDERRRDDRVADTAVDTAWRRASGEEPPAHVDAAIVAAARAEVGDRRHVRGRAPRTAWWSRWQPAVAAAGVIGLAFVLVQVIPRGDEARVPASRTAAPSESAATSAPTVLPEPAAAPTPATSNERSASAQEPAAVAIAPGPAAPAAAAQKADASRKSLAPDAAPASSAEQPALAGAAPRAAEQSVAAPSPAKPLSPEAWANRIAALHRAGEVTAAAAELQAFRAAYPGADRYLPEELRAWAMSEHPAESP